jgi:hypothetical protein
MVFWIFTQLWYNEFILTLVVDADASTSIRFRHPEDGDDRFLQNERTNSNYRVEQSRRTALQRYTPQTPDNL